MAVAIESKKRVWEVDFVRGICIFAVVISHLLYNFAYIFDADFSTPFGQALAEFSREFWANLNGSWSHYAWVMVLCFVSGISTQFSRNNFKKSLRVGALALAISFVTSVFTEVSGQRVQIYFGVLHMFCVCGLIWCLLDKIKTPFYIKIALGVAFVALGSYFWQNWLGNDTPFPLSILVSSISGMMFSPGDYFAVLPWLGWYLLGSVFAQFVYKDKTTRLPFINAKYLAPITFCGRHTLWLYCLGQVLGVGLTYLAVLIGIL